MVRKSNLFLATLVLTTALAAQESRDNTIGFIEHLDKLNEYNEGIMFISSLDTSIFSVSQLDSINYFKGRFYYKTAQPALSVSYLRKVRAQSSYYTFSRFFSGFQSAYLGDYNQSYSLLSNYQPQDTLIVALKNLQQSGLSLLQRDIAEFRKYEIVFGKYYQLAPYEKGLSIHAESLASFKNKSAFAAGLLSAIVPGAGRFYIGKVGEGIATILVTGVFGLQAWEGYRKDGPGSFRFILFSSFFGVSYIANIWGTTLAVRIRREEFNEQMNDSILLDMHIPIRTLLD